MLETRSTLYFAKEISEEVSEIDIPLSMVRKFKETYSYVGESESGARVKVPVEGKPHQIEIGKQVGISCNKLLDEVFDSIKESYRDGFSSIGFFFTSEYHFNWWWKQDQKY